MCLAAWCKIKHGAQVLLPALIPVDSAELFTKEVVEQAWGSASPEGSLPYYVKYAQETLIKLADVGASLEADARL